MNRVNTGFLALLGFGGVLSGCTALGQPGSSAYYGAPHNAYDLYQGEAIFNKAWQEGRVEYYNGQPYVVNQHVPPPQYAENRRVENGVKVYRPGVISSGPRHIEIAKPTRLPEPAPTYTDSYVFDESKALPLPDLSNNAPAYEPAPMPEVAPVMAYESAPRSGSTVDISYVKMGGGSDIADWEACEDLTGNYVKITDTGYEIDPRFDNCMRLKGYKPESEAEEILAGGN